MRRTWTIALSLTALLAGFGVWDLQKAPAGNIRSFDADTVGDLDTDMWRSYYERRPLRLFGQLAGLLRQQYGLSWTRSWVAAGYATRSAFVFKEGGGERALPALCSYYQLLFPDRDEAWRNEAARLELRWWVLHRERSPALVQSLADLQAHLFAGRAERFLTHATWRAKAMWLRDGQDQQISEANWSEIRGYLRTSWKELWKAVQIEPSSLKGS